MFSFLIASPASLIAQEGEVRVTEEYVNTEKVFIEASREKILGNFENAAFLFKEVLKRDRSNHAAAYELARVYDVLDKDGKALSSIKMAIKLDPSNTWYQMFAGDIYEKAGDFKSAASIYEKLTRQKKSKEYYYSKWAFYLVKAQQTDKAIEVYNQMEQTIGVSEEVCRKKHTLYVGKGELELAAAEYQKLIKAYPSEIRFRHYLAEFYQRIDEKTLANQMYEQILEIDPEDPDAALAMATGGGDTGDDITQLARLTPIFESDAVEIDNKIKELMPYLQKVVDTKDKTLARSILNLSETIETVHPKDAKGYSLSGDILYHTGDNAAALEKYQKAIQLKSNVFPIWENVMYIHAENKDYKSLLEVTDKALDYFPNQPKCYYFNGIANSELKKHKDAVSSYQQAIMMSRRDPALQHDLYYRMGLSYYELRQFKKSDQAFEKALAINPENVMLLNNYSFHLAQRGEKLELAKELSERCNKLQPNNSSFQDTYGWILYKLQDFKGAKKWLGKSLENGGDRFASTLEHYGDILYQLNERDEALRYWQLALQKGSTSGLLEKKIADKKLYE